ncbi:hypothetical protein CEXT_395901 [Caerostris extrusa]|uniref:Uncharacterized protein n=1 Tax=Caerostris extrusa TaxID=172846 RepID=A0AAV4PE60_CAEEX|nr:hypothetical protein CEXT_395901 [Caerostris extrusa]
MQAAESLFSRSHAFWIDGSWLNVFRPPILSGFEKASVQPQKMFRVLRHHQAPRVRGEEKPPFGPRHDRHRVDAEHPHHLPAHLRVEGTAGSPRTTRSAPTSTTRDTSSTRHLVSVHL